MQIQYAVLAAIIFVASGCADGVRSFSSEQPNKPRATVQEPARFSVKAPAAGTPAHKLSPAAVAARSATPTASPAAKKTGSKPPLMECVTHACQVNCADTVPKASRPKWCMYFKRYPTE